MTTGTIVFALGIALLVLGGIILIVLAATYPGSKKKINLRMKEKY